MMRILDIWWEGYLVGQLTHDWHGEMGSAYALEWLSDEMAQPLSASLPKRAVPLSRRECHPFLQVSCRTKASATPPLRRFARRAPMNSPFSIALPAMSRARCSSCRQAQRRSLLPTSNTQYRLMMQV